VSWSVGHLHAFGLLDDHVDQQEDRAIAEEVKEATVEESTAHAGHDTLSPACRADRCPDFESYASPARHFSVDLHRRQMRSPAQALGNGVLQTKQLRVLASASLSVSGAL
jgi:hypothetical protein